MKNAISTLTAAAAAALIAAPALAAPPAVAPAASWTGFYLGGEFGVGFSGSHGVNFSPNDPTAAFLFNGTFFAGQQPLASSQGLSESGPVFGFEFGYNWQTGSNWLWGFETDFSFSGISGQAVGPTSVLAAPTETQSTSANQSTDWYGTVRGRAGFLATPNLLLFGTGGLAYGRVVDSASYVAGPVGAGIGSLNNTGSFQCTGNLTCFAGSSSAIRTGWTAGGGAEWLLDQHWSAKIEYQFVDLGAGTIRVTALAPFSAAAPVPSSFNAAFRDQFHLVRIGLNYRY